MPYRKSPLYVNHRS